MTTVCDFVTQFQKCAKNKFPSGGQIKYYHHYHKFYSKLQYITHILYIIWWSNQATCWGKVCYYLMKQIGLCIFIYLHLGLKIFW